MGVGQGRGSGGLGLDLVESGFYLVEVHALPYGTGYGTFVAVPSVVGLPGGQYEEFVWASSPILASGSLVECQAKLLGPLVGGLLSGSER